MKKRIPLLYAFLCICIGSFAQVKPVSDLADGYLYIDFQTTIGDHFFFQGQSSSILWVSDGTEAGTRQITTSFTRATPKVFGDDIVIPSSSGIHRVNGQTLEVTLIGNYSFPGFMLDFLVQEDYYFFFLRIGSGQDKTYQVWSIPSVGGMPIVLYDGEEALSSWAVYDQSVLFATETDIWKTDGTEAGTSMFFDGEEDVVEAINLDEGLTYNDAFYFPLDIDTLGLELWRTDATFAGTQLVKDIHEGVYNSIFNNGKASLPKNLTEKDGQLYFLAFTEDRYNLYRTDGTTTTMVVDLYQAFDLNNIINFTLFKDDFYFLGLTPSYGYEWWKSDGTQTGTALLADTRKGSAGIYNDLYGIRTAQSDNYLYFNALNADTGDELWRTDGTEAGTQLVKDITVGIDWSYVQPLEHLNDQFYFIEGRGEDGFQLWSVDESLAIDPIPVSIPTDYDWFRSIGKEAGSYSNTGRTYLDELAIDGDDNVYLSGDFEGLYLSFFDSNNFLRANTDLDISKQNFLVSYDKNGDYRWAQQIGAGSWGIEQIIETDVNDDILVAGLFKEEGIFGTIRNNGGSGQMYLMKLDQDGNLIWLKFASIGRSGNAEVFEVTTDSKGNIYVAGKYTSQEARFGSLSISSEASSTHFIVKYDKNGNELWAENLELSSSDSRPEVTSLFVDGKDRVYTVLSDGGYQWFSSCEYRDWGFKLNAFDQEGTALWEKEWYSSDLSGITDAAASPTGEIFMLGRFRGELELDGQKLSTSCNDSKGFFMKVNSTGKILQVDVFDSENIYPYEIEFGSNGNYYIAGRQHLKGDIPSLGLNYFQNFRSKIFVNKYNQYDRLLEQRLINKRHDDDYETNINIVLDSEEKIILADQYGGNFFDTIPNGVYNSNQHVFLMKFGLDAEADYPEDLELSEDEVLLYPNPADDYLQLFSEDIDFQNARLSIFDSTGRSIGTVQASFNFGLKLIDVSDLSPGIYILRIESEEDSITKKFVKAYRN